MRTIKAQKLTVELFEKYGAFRDLFNPTGPRLGEPPVEFFRDMMQQQLGCVGCPSFSCGRFAKRPWIVDTCECHTSSGEAYVSLNSDVAIHTAVASLVGSPPFDAFEAFLVPKATLVVLRPGVWHYAPFPVDCDIAHMLYVLPERAYANDCIVHAFPQDARLRIVL